MIPTLGVLLTGCTLTFPNNEGCSPSHDFSTLNVRGQNVTNLVNSCLERIDYQIKTFHCYSHSEMKLFYNWPCFRLMVVCVIVTNHFSSIFSVTFDIVRQTSLRWTYKVCLILVISFLVKIVSFDRFTEFYYNFRNVKLKNRLGSSY